ncbi:SulP family inorganic anion transporter [Kribbella sp. VKM Ac-2568]|uniref:SulP family inorganic anion transporter n=1 Tax=Kribbella sp. VKM Ac-2568 TaxID=2512219 RepID=UPI00105272B6|nr:SulP family inorganic anion transporter [Kribbella sp. VKM Ac-2568]TCM38534.1 high affinity sulfate transporter 1 [Kribbella sp. VKM Ac-2568]
MRLIPESLRGYRQAWLSRDLIAGLTLSAVAIPEVMGYTSIAGTPIVTGLYTIIFPTLIFALLGSSRLLVVGADSATAAVLAAGLSGLGIAGVTPGSPDWLAFASLTALVCGAMLVVARLLRLGFIGDFLSASVLIGFLTGVGIQVLSGQIPDLLGIPKGSGNWFEQQWHWITSLSSISLGTFAFGLATIVIIRVFKRFIPVVPGAIVAVVLLTAISALADAHANGVSVVGAVEGGFPPIGLPSGLSWSDVSKVLPTALSCFVLIIAQSAATSRSFAFKHGDAVDINRDIVGLSGASLAAGLSGTFVVNGSPTKTQILDEQQGRTQLANLTMAAVALLFTLFFTGLLADMPTAVLAGIVFLIGVSLIDLPGLKRLWGRRKNEFAVALITTVTVFAVGVEQGIILAIALSLLDLVRRQYTPGDFVIGQNQAGEPTYLPAVPGTQSLPGLVVFRYDAELFYANANRFADHLEAVISAAPDPVRWVALDCGTIDDIDYSAGVTLANLVNYSRAHNARFVLVRPDTQLLATLRAYGILDTIGEDNIYPTIETAFRAYRADPGTAPAAAQEPAGPS